MYYIFTESGTSAVVASMIAALILSIFSRAFAVIRKNPGTMYLLPGIFPIVPGAGIYYTAYYLFTGNQELFSQMGLTTFETAGAIVFGIIFGFAIPQGLFNKLAALQK